MVTNEPLKDVDIVKTRGVDKNSRQKDVEVDIKGTKVKVRIVSTLKEAELKKLHERIGNYILKNYKKTEKIKVKKDTKVIRKVKYLNEKRLEGFIYSVALEQQNTINKSIDEYYKRMENNLIV